MSDLRSDLGYLLRQLQRAADPQISPDVVGIPMHVSPEDFLESIIQTNRECQHSLALMHRARAELQAINDELPRWWALLEQDEAHLRAAE